MNTNSFCLTSYGSRYLFGGTPSDVERVRNLIENYDSAPCNRARTIEVRPVHKDFAYIQNVTPEDIRLALVRGFSWDLRQSFNSTHNKLALQKEIEALVDLEFADITERDFSIHESRAIEAREGLE